MDWSLVLNWAGLGLGILGLVTTAVQTVRLRRISYRRQQIIRHFIDRANYASLDSDVVVDLLSRHSYDPLLARYVLVSRQVAADLYLLAVDEYLAQERRFTYRDLLAIADTPLVGGRWQMRAWLGKLVLRPENRGTAPPPIPDLKDGRLDHYERLRAYASPSEADALSLEAAGPEAASDAQQ